MDKVRSNVTSRCSAAAVGGQLSFFEISMLRRVTDEFLIRADLTVDKAAKRGSEKWLSHRMVHRFSSFREIFRRIAFHINIFVLSIFIPIFA